MKVFSFEPLWSSRRQVPYRVIGIFCHRATQGLLVSVLPVAITSLSQNVGEGVYRGLVAYFASVAFDLFRLSHRLLPIGLIGSPIAHAKRAILLVPALVLMVLAWATVAMLRAPLS